MSFSSSSSKSSWYYSSTMPFWSPGSCSISSSSSISSSISSLSTGCCSSMARSMPFSSIALRWESEIFFRSDIIFSWICKLISNSMFCSSRTWFFMMIYRNYRFYFDFTFFGISSRIFLVDVILSISCKFVISFFSMFFWVLSFNVWIVLVSDFIYYWHFWA